MNARAFVHCNITRPVYRTLDFESDSTPHPMTSVEGCDSIAEGKRGILSLFERLRVNVSIAK